MLKTCESGHIFSDKDELIMEVDGKEISRACPECGSDKVKEYGK